MSRCAAAAARTSTSVGPSFDMAATPSGSAPIATQSAANPGKNTPRFDELFTLTLPQEADQKKPRSDRHCSTPFIAMQKLSAINAFVPYMRVHKCAMILSIGLMRKAQDEQVLKAVAAEIKARRASIDINQEELAHRAEVHRSFVARVEVAETQPSLAVLLRFADALEVDASELVRGITERLRRERAQGAATS